MVLLQHNVQRQGRMTGLETKKFNIILFFIILIYFIFFGADVELKEAGSSGLTRLWLTPLGE